MLNKNTVLNDTIYSISSEKLRLNLIRDLNEICGV